MRRVRGAGPVSALVGWLALGGDEGNSAVCLFLLRGNTSFWANVGPLFSVLISYFMVIG